MTLLSSRWLWRAVVILSSVVLGAGAAFAHDAFEITAIARLQPDALVLDITMSRSTAMAIATGNKEAALASKDFPANHAKIEAAAAQLYTITAAGAPLALRSTEVKLDREEDVAFHLVYPRPPGGPLVFRAPHVVQLAYGYGDSLTVHGLNGRTIGNKLLTETDSMLEIALPADLSPTAPPVAVTPPVPSAQFRPFLVLGIEHILTGYDHLLFLCGLLVACRRFSTMLGVITCFTIAHSLTLALAALGVVSLSSRLVEPLIAASIAIVGVENLLRRHEEPRGRWLLTFGFGLVHGFGFAGALRAAGLGASGASVAWPLFSFNLGVELGQLAVTLLLLPVLLWLRSRPAFVRYGLPAVSAVVALAGLYWLLQRTVFS